MTLSSLLLDVFNRLYSAYGPQKWWPGETQVEIIVGAVLTQNTNWGNVEKAISNLKDAGVLSLNALNRLSVEQISLLIKPAGYYNVKAKRLKNLVEKLIDIQDYIERMDMKDLREELLSVNGIGKETADSILLYAFNRPIFVVDAYTKRIFNRLGVASINDNYDVMQDLFMSNLPRDVALYSEYHALIVRHAKDVCLKKKPRCNACIIQEVCRYDGV